MALTPRARTLVQVFAVFALAIAVIAGLSRVPFLREYLQVVVAVIFLLLPIALERRPGALEAEGFTTHPRALGVRVFAVWSVVVLPLFCVGFVLYFRFLCAHWPQMATLCFRVAHPSFRLPPDFLLSCAGQLIV